MMMMMKINKLIHQYYSSIKIMKRDMYKIELERYNMYHVIRRVENNREVTLAEIGNLALNNHIIVCERGEIQNILIYGSWYHSSPYSWQLFYCRKMNRTKYSTIKEAIESRFEKGYEVYVLDNKRELKEFIKHR